MTTSVQDLLDGAFATLHPILGDDCARDAQIILAHVLGISTASLRMRMTDDVTRDQSLAFNTKIAQRAAFQPVSQIIGTREFWGREFLVTPDVLDPRPDTETLIEAALELPAPNRILDLGLGTGCILFTLLAEWRNATGVGIDVSPAALAVAKQNANALHVANRAELQLGDWFNTLDEKFDLIVSNPPYITASEMNDLSRDVADWEPHLALTPGGDGLGAYRIIAAKAQAYLNEGGNLMLEIGWQQSESVSDLLKQHGWADLRILRDLGGNTRVICAKPPKIRAKQPLK
ncbi:release factor glutamine methyltransferase [Amylibacter ulvae]|uniref:Release factor glutamine methyltransferase n=1 Tax=Paramylibacter ulvae TaxID=1651968 RepID=A0ABQ3CR78_9RHOB|nr:peptide chain release factor N(5)-glutamine methyltransferase [Amylibacter ulvae]GHA40363.1 release factor glutamine methyltransferase [Amylibacter ulvae]